MNKENNNKKVICILADALRFDYIKRYDMSFLREKIESGNCFYAKKIIPSTGFCEIAEYVQGKNTAEHGFLAQITIKKDWQDIKRKRKLDTIQTIHSYSPIRKIPRIKYFYKLILDKYLETIISKEVVNIRYNIPLNLLPFIRPTESKFEYDNSDFGKSNMFIWMKNNKISYDIDDFVKHNKVRGTDKNRMNNLERKIHNKNLKDFTMLYIGYGELAHFLGPDSYDFGKVMKDFSKSLENIYRLMVNNYHNFDLIILGDHGMLKVGKYVDIIKIIDFLMMKMGLKYLNDYIYFVDSTMLRIWLKKKSFVPYVKQRLMEKIGEVIECDLETEKYLSKFIPVFGDIIFLLKPGNVFFPDFFNEKKNKGMHGYLNKYKNQAGTLLNIGKNHDYKESMELNEVKNYIQSLWEN